MRKNSRASFDGLLELIRSRAVKYEDIDEWNHNWCSALEVSILRQRYFMFVRMIERAILNNEER